MWLCFLAEIFIAYVATEAVLAVTVDFLELYQGLGVSGIGGIESSLVPHPHHTVLLGLQLLKETEAAGTYLLVSLVPAIGKEHGDDSIDDDHMERLAGERLCRLTAGLAKIVMGLPVCSGRSGESSLKLLYRLAAKNIAETGTAGEIKIGELRDSYLREVLRMKPQKLPERVVHRR